MKTKITELFGIQYPIIQGGMMRVGTADIAAAVSNAGGLGMVTAGNFPTGDALKAEIVRCQSMTSKPFGVNLTFIPAGTPPPYDDYIQAIIETGVKIVETAGRSPEEYLPVLKANGIKVIHKCTSVRHALKAEKIGCDAVSVDGFECAGHPGEDDIPNLVLLPLAYKRLKIPMVASGGIATGSQLVACLALGAEGINMGTRFVATKEAPIHQNYKDSIVQSSELDTALIFRPFKNTARVYKNAIAIEVQNIEKTNPNADFLTDIYPLVSGKRAAQAFEKGDTQDGMWTAGMVMGLIDDVPSCETLIQNIITEAQAIITERLRQFV